MLCVLFYTTGAWLRGDGKLQWSAFQAGYRARVGARVLLGAFQGCLANSFVGAGPENRRHTCFVARCFARCFVGKHGRLESWPDTCKLDITAVVGFAQRPPKRFLLR